MTLYKSLLDRLKNQHQTIEHLIEKTAESRLTFRPGANKWSIHDNIVHLAKYQPVFLQRMNLILKENSPTFERYTAENDPLFETWRKNTIPELLKILNTDRQAIFDRISNLSEKELQRTGVHRKFGALTVIQWTEFFLLHEAHHLFTIFQLANDSEIH